MRASRYLVVLILMTVVLAVPTFGQDPPPVTTTRDARGVWFIEGGSMYDVYEAMGYAVAKDRLFQLDLFRRQGDGRLSELLGPSQLQTDIGLRLFSYSDAELAQQFDNVIGSKGLGPYNAARGQIVYRHPIFGEFWRTPFSSRSTYAHCVEFDMNGPSRIESMFPLGESGALYFAGTTTPSFDPHAFSMTPVFDPFMPRPFPLFN